MGAAVANAAPLDMQHPYSAGAMYSTVEDLLKWDQALYTTTLLPDAAKKIMWTPFKNSYAYGWTIVEPSPATFGHKRVVHTVGINGFSSVIVRLPDSNVTSIVLSNNESAPAAPVARDLLAIYFGQPYTAPAPQTVAKVDPAVFDRYVGKYQLTPALVLTITREGDSLMAQAPGQSRLELYPQSETSFFAKATRLSVTFVEEGGKVSHVILNQGGPNRQAKKIE
jgi:CubicO group peptidase (beta-lactamase class C family)